MTDLDEEFCNAAWVPNAVSCQEAGRISDPQRPLNVCSTERLSQSTFGHGFADSFDCSTFPHDHQLPLILERPSSIMWHL